jgi:hypothetical protein
MKIVEVNAVELADGSLVYENPYDDPGNWICDECGAWGDDDPGFSHHSACESKDFQYCGPKDTPFTGPSEGEEVQLLDADGNPCPF